MRLIDADALTEFLKCLMPERGMWEIEGDPAKDAICETVAEAIEMVKNMETIQPEPAIPLSWIDEQIEWLKGLDNTFSTLTATQISAMVKKWRDEQNETY